MSLASRIRELRESKKLSLEELASKAKISKTYLWELEKDEAGEKKPSADVLYRIATALATTMADLMSLPTVRVQHQNVEIPPTLREFAELMKSMSKPLSEEDQRDLAAMKFRGGQPKTVEEWQQLYLVFAMSSRKPKT